MRPNAVVPRVDDVTRQRFAAFVHSCIDSDGAARLTRSAEPTPFALCFAIFGLHLVQEREAIERQRAKWSASLRAAVRLAARERSALVHLGSDKHFLQLLTFGLSALKILGALEEDLLGDVVTPLLPHHVEKSLMAAGAHRGVARSGNQAMFLAILLLHAQRLSNLDVQDQLGAWVSAHLRWMNRFGFWGPDTSMSHLQFQNGYHQYEIFEYLNTEQVPWHRAADAVASLADAEGHFAPYPGGGGCYDYDAIFLLTATQETVARHSALLEQTARTLLVEQNPDGGFAESLRIRPRSWESFARAVRHAASGRGQARWERVRQALTLQRSAHDRIATHWSRYARGWGESDLWDSWFRMLTLARIECALDPAALPRWGFIDFPGIGFHRLPHARG